VKTQGKLGAGRAFQDSKLVARHDLFETKHIPVEWDQLAQVLGPDDRAVDALDHRIALQPG